MLMVAVLSGCLKRRALRLGCGGFGCREFFRVTARRRPSRIPIEHLSLRENYALASTFFALFLAAAFLATVFTAVLAVAFSVTGPWVSALGNGGASPMRFE